MHKNQASIKSDFDNLLELNFFSKKVLQNENVCDIILLARLRVAAAAKQNGPVVQLVRTLACHARGHGFESRPDRQFLNAFGNSFAKGLDTPL